MSNPTKPTVCGIVMDARCALADLNRVPYHLQFDKPRLRRCPTCDSPSPELHPAMQFEGEVQPCRDKWHAARAAAGEESELPQSPPAGLIVALRRGQQEAADLCAKMEAREEPEP